MNQVLQNRFPDFLPMLHRIHFHSMPAKVHNLEGRGILKEGSFADITLIDLHNLEVLSDEIETRRHPKGIEYVFINGEAVVERGTHTGATPGKVLKKT